MQSLQLEENLSRIHALHCSDKQVVILGSQDGEMRLFYHDVSDTKLSYKTYSCEYKRYYHG